MTLDRAVKIFETRAPSVQNAIDIFKGTWASDFGETCPGLRAGTIPLFTDARLQKAANLLGRNGRLDGMSVLELGPLEGAHTYQLERLGASSIISIEANAESFLKCLITKEILGLLRTQFLFGDFVEYLRTTDERFDMVLCSGVLYHMSDPIELIRQIAKVTQKCFVWTHYFDSTHYPGPRREVRHDPRYPDVRLHTLEFHPLGMNGDQYWGGNKPVSVWLEREAILESFGRAGFSKIEVTDDQPDHPNGACLSFTARAAA